MRIEKNDVSGRVYTSTRRRRIKLCRPFPGENTQSCVSVHHSTPTIPDAAIQVAARRKMQLQETVVALTREKAPFYPPAYIQRATMNFDGSFFPRGAFGRNDADLHYAIYVRDLRARPHSFAIYVVVGCARRKNTPFRSVRVSPFFSFPYLFFIITSRFAVSLARYTCVHV